MARENLREYFNRLRQGFRYLGSLDWVAPSGGWTQYTSTLLRGVRALLTLRWLLFWRRPGWADAEYWATLARGAGVLLSAALLGLCGVSEAGLVGGARTATSIANSERAVARGLPEAVNDTRAVVHKASAAEPSLVREGSAFTGGERTITREEATILNIDGPEAYAEGAPASGASGKRAVATEKSAIAGVGSQTRTEAATASKLQRDAERRERTFGHSDYEPTTEPISDDVIRDPAGAPVRVSYAGRHIFDRAATNPVLISLAPRDARSFSSVFGREAPGSIERQLDQFDKLLSHHPVGVVDMSSSRRMTTDDLKRALTKNWEASNFVILGHSNNSGRTLVFPGGAHVDVTEIHNLCASLEVVCHVLTCYGKDFNLHTEIEFIEAFKMWQYARDLSASEYHSVDKFVGSMIEHRDQLADRRRIGVAGIVVVGGGGVAAVAYVKTK
ncbi:hypothetical protein WMF38_51780 [Sorangium sp. So ce118]